ncbi:MAG: PorP/SprF family type IX secretion system membrane protein [Crocinitomicaceae bacterium]
MKKALTSISYLLAAVIICLSGESFAQQEGHYLNMASNPFMLNPAAGGLSDVANIELSFRNQWSGYSGSPRSVLLMGHTPLKVGKDAESALSEFNNENATLFKSPTRTTGKMKHILGGRAMYDGIGPFNKTSIYGSYAFHLPFTKTINFGAGIGLGWSNLGINQDRVVLYQQDDAAYTQFLGNTSSQNILDANAGIVFYGEKLFVGVSTTQLLRNSVEFDDVVTESNFNRHYFLVAKYEFELNEQFAIEPTVVAKYVQNSPFSGDIGARFIYNKASWLALQYRTSNAFTFQLGTNIVKNIYLSYGFEMATGPLRTGTSGTHELQLGFYIGNNRNVTKEIKESAE